MSICLKKGKFSTRRPALGKSSLGLIEAIYQGTPLFKWHGGQKPCNKYKNSRMYLSRKWTLFLGAALRETPIMHNGRVVGGRNRIKRDNVA